MSAAGRAELKGLCRKWCHSATATQLAARFRRGRERPGSAARRGGWRGGARWPFDERGGLPHEQLLGEDRRPIAHTLLAPGRNSHLLLLGIYRHLRPIR